MFDFKILEDFKSMSSKNLKPSSPKKLVKIENKNYMQAYLKE